MNLQPRRRQQPEINLTPLIDVVFLLLIFFMVSTTFRKEADLQIQLPEAAQQPVPLEHRLEVSVDAAGRYAVNGQAVIGDDVASLKQAMQQAVAQVDDLPLMIRADGQASHQSVVKIMDVAGQLGLKRLGIATIYSGQDQAPASGQ